MPLIKSKSEQALKTNIKTLMGEVGKSPHVQSREQALGIAYAMKRRAKAAGGAVFEGPIVSHVPGRTDHLDMDVAAGSFVLPADHVSSLGEGNTLAGMEYLKKIGPHGIRKLIERQGIKGKSVKPRKRGGTVGHPVPIAAAGGEQVLSPEEVATIGGGDVDKGHSMLDAWIVANRKKHISTLRKLPGPARD